MPDELAETAPGPSLDRLDAEGIEAIHDASMRIVEQHGIQIAHDRARSIFEAHGARVDDDVVRIPRDLVEMAVEAAPERFTLHARNPDNDCTVGGDGPPVRAPGHGPTNLRTVAEGRRPATLADVETLLKLVQTEPAMTCTGYNVCEPNDVDRATSHLQRLERALTLTDKPIMGPTYGADRAQACMDMVGLAVGDPDLSKPYVAGLINTAPPRSIDAEMLEGLLTYADHGQVPVISSFTMAGASAPPTLAATMAQANAETLAGITLAQLVNSGTPVVYGIPSSTIDDRYGSLCIASPESALFVAFAGQMGRYYGLPSRGGGGLTDSKAVDYQAGFESALLSTLTATSGIDFVLHAAGMLESYSTVSPEKFVLDCELLGYLDRIRGGVTVDDDHLAMDLVPDIGPAGHFLGETAADGAFYRSTVADKRSYGDWADEGGKESVELAYDRVERQLDAYQRPPMDDDVRRDLRSYVEREGTPAR